MLYSSVNAITDRGDALRYLRSRHPEYHEYVQSTRWILDTLEGGDRYRDADYGADRWGRRVRNLIRMAREMPAESLISGTAPVGQPASYGRSPFSPSPDDRSMLRDAAEEMYETRRARTPVPGFLSQFIDKQLSKIYKRPISRDGGPEIAVWCDNIDGRETTIDEWMRETVAPLLCALGMIDVAFDHPRIGPDEPMILGREVNPARECVASFYLPENVLNWTLDYTNRYYLDVLLQEFEWDADAGPDGQWVERFRHWTHEDWTLYDRDGNILDGAMHPFGVCPVVRLFDRRNFRMDHAALCRMYPIADLSRCYYNEESEMIASLTQHNCPIIQGPPEDAADAGNDQTVPVGRNLILRKSLLADGSESKYEYVEQSTSAYEFVRVRLSDLQTRMEAHAALTRSVGSVGAGGSQAVAQSGISKAYDQTEGSDYLASFARTLQIADYTACYFATIVLFDGKVPSGYMDKLTVIYPTEFNLLTFTDVALIDETITAHLTSAAFGMVPTADKTTLKMMYRKQHPDIDKYVLDEIDKEIDAIVDEAAKKRQDDMKHEADMKKAALDNLANPPQSRVGPAVPGGSPPVPLPNTPLPTMPNPVAVNGK